MRTLALFAIAFGVLFGTACGGRMSGSSDDFSPTVNGLRGRLIISGGGPLTVDLELENLGTTSVHVSLGDPNAVVPTVTDATGNVMAPAGNFPAAQVAAQVVEIPAAGRKRTTISVVHDNASLSLGSSFWNLSRGMRYQLLATWSSHVEGGETPWTGQLQLPATKINF